MLYYTNKNQLKIIFISQDQFKIFRFFKYLMFYFIFYFKKYVSHEAESFWLPQKLLQNSARAMISETERLPPPP